MRPVTSMHCVSSPSTSNDSAVTMNVYLEGKQTQWTHMRYTAESAQLEHASSGWQTAR